MRGTSHDYNEARPYEHFGARKDGSDQNRSSL